MYVSHTVLYVCHTLLVVCYMSKVHFGVQSIYIVNEALASYVALATPTMCFNGG